MFNELMVPHVYLPILRTATVLIDYKDDPSSYGNDARFKDDVKRLEATLPQKVRQHERERPVRFVDAGAATLIPG
jgi:hypothetical protein